jgi:hypothetical protein
MRKIRSSLPVVLLFSCCSLPAQKAPAVMVRQGEWLHFETLRGLDSATTNAGERVPLRLTEPFVVDGVTLLTVGAKAEGRVSKVQRLELHCRQGEVQWSVDSISFPDGSKLAAEIREICPWNDRCITYPTKRDRCGARCVALRVWEAPLWVVALPFYLGEKIHHCDINARDYVLPERSRVTVGILGTRSVHYTPRTSTQLPVTP